MRIYLFKPTLTRLFLYYKLNFLAITEHIFSNRPRLSLDLAFSTLRILSILHHTLAIFRCLTHIFVYSLTSYDLLETSLWKSSIFIFSEFFWVNPCSVFQHAGSKPFYFGCGWLYVFEGSNSILQFLALYS